MEDRSVEAQRLVERKLTKNGTSLRMAELTRNSGIIPLQIYYLLTVKRRERTEVKQSL